MALSVGDVFYGYVVNRDSAGAQAASVDIACKVKKPDGTEATASHAGATSGDLTAINNANALNPDWTDLVSTTGVYVVNVSLTQAGSWWLRWSATNPVQFAEQQAFYVDAQRVSS
jgi:hypothetical protein